MRCKKKEEEKRCKTYHSTLRKTPALGQPYLAPVQSLYFFEVGIDVYL